jgi:hypothetical protein
MAVFLVRAAQNHVLGIPRSPPISRSFMTRR